jgi:hypothetical protein
VTRTKNRKTSSLVLYVRWRKARRSRHAGAGFKPLCAFISKDMVVNDKAKGALRRQVSFRETNANEPPKRPR